MLITPYLAGVLFASVRAMQMCIFMTIVTSEASHKNFRQV